MNLGVALRRVLAVFGILLLCCGLCRAAGTGIDYNTTIQPIYNNYCIACHNSPFGSGLQDLTAGNSYSQTVNVATMTGGTSKAFRVLPDAATSSGVYEVLVIDGSGANHQGNTWVSTAADKTNITNWINQGALPDTGAPSVTNVSPNSGSIAGGTTVTITGTKFGGAGTFLPTVTIGGAAATNVVVAAAGTGAQNSFNTITCKVPAHGAGGADVVVTTTAGGASAALTNGFTYISPTPTISNISPNTGPQAGGQSVTLTGTNYVAGASVTFGGSAATNIVVVSATQITCTTPGHAPGAADVVVTTSGGTVTSTGGYTYFATPAISNINPAVGPSAGGTAITLTGSGFIAGTAVTFGGSAAGNIVVSSATQINCTTPAHATGPVNVVVSNTGGSVTSTNGFTYADAPTIATVSPNTGPVAGGQSVTINGTNFISGATVTIGGNNATNVNIASATQITCLTPAHAAGAFDVVVTTIGGTATSTNGYTYFNAPLLSNVAPSGGLDVGDDSVTLTGVNFANGFTSVTFGGLNALNIVVVNAGQITCSTPAHSAGIVDVVVTTPGGSSTLTNGFTYRSAPAISTIVPNAGPSAGGQSVTITGTNFISGTTVTFGGNPATNVNLIGSTQLTCLTPAHVAGAVDVVVTTIAASATSTGGYTYDNPPTLATVLPGNGPAGGGLSVTLTGTNFVIGAGVTFDGLSATNINVTSSTQIACLIPPHAVGAVNVIVTTPGGPVTLTNGFTYTNAPSIRTIVPDEGPSAGGQTVVLTGTDFAAGATVTFGGTSALGISVDSATQITCTTPLHAAGAADVVVVTGAGTWTTTGGYSFFDAPTFTSIVPNTGPSAGGQSISITGTNFIAGATVTLGGAPATDIVVVSDAQINCTTSAHASGIADVVVTTAGGTVTSSGAYTFFDAPTLTDITPNFGLVAGGTSVTLSGTNFIAGTTVTFGGGTATNVVVVSATQITCSTPNHAAGAVDVVVTNAGGTATLASGYTYFAVPTVTSIVPNGGPVAGGQTVTITGSGFVSGAGVTIDGAAANGVAVISGTQLTCTTPAHAAATVDVAVTTLGGTGTKTNAYTYFDPPTIVSITPSAGPPGGGQSVTIAGTNFAAGANVTIGGNSATQIAVNSATEIVCKTPAHGAGLADVVVTTPGGVTTLSSGYRYAIAPAFTSIDSETFIVGTPGTFVVKASGTPLPSLGTASTLPSPLQLIDNGDGTATLSGTPGAGTAGVYTITITATNAGGSIPQTFTLTIITPPSVVGSGIDSDGDGFSDAFETAVGTNPLDASSTPFGGAKAPTPIALTVTSQSISLNFAKASSDAIKFAGVVNIPGGFAPLGSKVYLDVGGVAKSFTLDAKGSSKSGSNSLKITIKAKKGMVAAQVSKYAVALSKGSFAAQLADEQLTSKTISKAPVSVTFTLLINNNVLQLQKNLLYTAKQGKTGTAK